MEIQVEFWHWWVLALCFIVFYAMIPTGIFLALTVATGVMGAVITQFPYMEIPAQLALCSTITICCIVFFNYYRQNKQKNQIGSGDSPAQAMIGQEFELTLPIVNGISEITLDNTHWSLKGPRIQKGTLVRVLKTDGEMLMVMPVSIINEYREEQSAKEE